MDFVLAAFDYLSGGKGWEVFEPEAGGFGFAMAKLPRLDDLGGFADAAGDDGDGVFEGDAFHGGIEEELDEGEGFGLFDLFVFEPAGTTDGEVGAGRVGYQ